MRFRTRRWPSGCLSHALPWHVSVKISRFWLYDGLPACPDRRNVAKKSSGEMLYPRLFSQIWPHQNSLILVFQCRLMYAQFCICTRCSRRLRGTLLKLIPLCTAGWLCEAVLKTFFYCLILVSGSSLSQPVFNVMSWLCASSSLHSPGSFASALLILSL